jgi:ribose transport system substrate-binding protein
MKINKILPIFAMFLGCFSSQVIAYQEGGNYLDFAIEKVERAIRSNQTWDGPKEGPKLSRDKKIIFVASDLRNGGVYGVAKGMSEAVSHLDWHLRFIDSRGSETRQGAGLREAIGFRPDAIILGGIDALRHKEMLLRAKSLGIVVVGWHASELAGSNNDLGLFTNITTDPLEVAEVAALLAIVDSKGKAKVIVFSDPNYKIASIKASVMVDTIKRCTDCSVLELKPLPLDQIAEKMPETADYLWSSYGERITHILTINDLYIDYAIPSLESRLEENKTIPSNISAGDGSKAAYKRIKQKNFQLATVPEPLYLQGWQIIDELNRAFNNHSPSGYSTPIHLVTPNNVDELMNQKDVGVYDPHNGYREHYLKIWEGK